jgi:hypothetical protein
LQYFFITLPVIVNNDRLLINIATSTLKEDPAPLAIPLQGRLRNLHIDNLSQWITRR